jgi:hypothetical protein
MSKMTRQEIEALLRLLDEFEREELEILMQERREAERMVQYNARIPDCSESTA